MIKYYYYVYRSENKTGSGVARCEGEFDVVDTMHYLNNLGVGSNVFITNWQEISSGQFEKLRDYYAKSQK